MPKKTIVWLLAVWLGAGAGAAARAGDMRERPSARPGAGDVEDEEEASRPYVIDAERRAAERLRAVYGLPGALARDKASRVHDRVTIVINDSLTASNTQKTDFKRASNTDWRLDDFFTVRIQNGDLVAVPRMQNAAADTGQPAKTPRFKFSGNAAHAADGKNNVSSALKTEISGSVIEVLPNGHLVVEAKKSQIVNRESQAVIFTGRVDPRDLDSASRVEDRYVIDREVRIEGKGVFANFNRRGRIAAFMDWLNPF